MDFSAIKKYKVLNILYL